MPVIVPHSQSRAYWRLFPKFHPDMDESCSLAGMFSKYWKIPSISWLGLTSEAPNYLSEQAENSGIDHSLRLFAHFEPDDKRGETFQISLGRFPFPDENGEFVIGGNRFYMPMFLRHGAPGKRLDKFKRFFPELDVVKEWEALNDKGVGDWRNPDQLYVLLLDDLLLAVTGIKARMAKAFASIDPADLAEDPIKTLRNRLSRMLYIGRHTFVHDLIVGGPGKRGYGKLVDTSNPLARLSQRREISFYGPCGGIHPESVSEYYLRDVHENDLHRICPVEAAQGHTVGLRLNMSRRAEVSVESRRITSPPEQEAGDSLGHAASLIPFVEHNDVNRALMGANMMKQAVPLLEPDIPWIQTGWEKEVAEIEGSNDSCKKAGLLTLGKNLFTAYMPWGLETFEDGIVISESASAALTTNQEKILWFEQSLPAWRKKDNWKMTVTPDNSLLSDTQKQHLDENGIVRVGSVVGAGDVLVSAIRKKYPDVGKTQTLDMLVSTALSSAPEKVEDASFYAEKMTGEVIDIIDSDNIKGFLLPRGVARRIGIKIVSRRPAMIGDKIAGRHGNKGVIVNIYPDRELPYIKTDVQHCTDDACPVSGPHRHAQIVLNSLGVIGRLNLGQLFETTLGRIAEKNKAPIIARPFENIWTLETLAAELQGCGFPEDAKEQFFVHRNGSESPLQFKSLAGVQYIIRLPHIAKGKIMGRGSPGQFAYSQRDNQPHRGKRYIRGSLIEGGQRIGEMETWALAGHSAWNLLDDFFNFKSDDLLRRKRGQDQNSHDDGVRRPQAFITLIMLMRALGLDLRLLDENDAEVTGHFIKNLKGLDFRTVALSMPKPERMDQWGLVDELSLDDLTAEPATSSEKNRHRLLKPWQMKYINFPCPVLHPLLAESLWEIFHFPQKLEDYLAQTKEESGVFSVWAAELADLLLETAEWPHLAEPEDEDLKRHFRGLDKLIERLESVGLQPKDLLMNKLPVVPRSFYVGQLQFGGELVRRYRNILYFNGRIAAILKEEGEGREKLQNERQKLQLSLAKLFGIRRSKGLLGILQGKTGLMRGNLAGKRADFSGRAVIVGAPDLGLDEAGLPEYLWDKLFPGVEKDQRPIILLNRQPSLHRYSFQAFHAVYHDQGAVIRLNPFVCAPFNADFDGDTIAVHIPRTQQAKTEAERLLPSRNLFSQASGSMVLGFDRDLALAATLLTYSPEISSDDEVPFPGDRIELRAKEHIWTVRTVDGIVTTVGRLRLKQALGPDVPLANRTLNKSAWSRCVSLVARTNSDVFPDFTKAISDIFSEALQNSGLSASLADFNLYRSKGYQPDSSPNFLWFASQAGRYSEDLERQITSSRGYMRRPQDLITDENAEGGQAAVEVKSCLLDGHPEEDYLLSAHGARAGLVDRGLNTSYSGHLMRDWVLRVQHLRIVADDCGCGTGLPLAELDASLFQGTRFDLENKLLESDASLQVRSPVTCRAKDQEGHPGVCQRCYGLDPSTGQLPELGLTVGILAAQALAERITQLTMRTFHTGGAQAAEGEAAEKYGQDLVRALRKILGRQNKDHLGKLVELLKNFPKSGRPNVVHFEVLLKGYADKRDIYLLSALFKSQSLNQVLDLALSNATDDIATVLSRLASGRIGITG